MEEYIFSDGNGGNSNGSGNDNGDVPTEHTENTNPTPTQNPTHTYTPGYYTAPTGAYQTYQYAYAQPAPAKKKRSKGKTVIAVIAVTLAVLLLAGGAGFGGYYIASRIFGLGEGGGNDGGDVVIDAGKDETGKKDPPVTEDPSTGVVLTPDSLGTKDKGTIAEVVSKVADSVVEITTEFAKSDSFYYTEGAGSGVIIDEGGYLLTNNHVIEDDSYGIADKITVRLANGDEYIAKLVGTDSDTDIAVLKIDAEGLVAAEIGTSSGLSVGEEVVIIGNPLGTLGGTVTNGIISALDREITVGSETMNLLQTNAAVNPGNSGGGMFNLAGELVGIVNAKYSESGIEGLAFAIPMDDVIYVANEILEYGYVKGRVSLRISVIDIDSYSEATYYRVNALGVYVYSAEEGYNDEVLQNGDRIAQVDDTEITCFADLKAILKSHNVGDTLEAVIVRNGRYSTVTLTCYERAADSEGVDFAD